MAQYRTRDTAGMRARIACPMSPALSPLTTKPATISDAVFERIRQAIVTRALPPGARITEAGLAAELHVSKTPVREALLRLREIGLIEPEGARGNRVVNPTAQSLHDAYELRRVLETFTAGAAAERATPAQAEQIADAAERSLQAAKARSFARFRKPDAELHTIVAEAAGNVRIARAIADVTGLIRALRERDRPEAEAIVEFGEGHVRIADAITRGDATAAGAEMQRHLELVERVLLGE